MHLGYFLADLANFIFPKSKEICGDFNVKRTVSFESTIEWERERKSKKKEKRDSEIE